MKTGALWNVSVVTTSEAEEAVGELLQRLVGHPASSYTDIETRLTRVAAYLAKKPNWARLRMALFAGLTRINQCGLQTAPARVSIQRLRRIDWTESWKRHFRPISVGSKLLIKPSWSRRRAHRGQAIVVLNPGLSFGTGQHPTTSFCLKQLAARRRPGQIQSFLDIGTGSGILAIAAARMGYAPVAAIDSDPMSIRVARENARRNRVSEKIRIQQGDITKKTDRWLASFRFDLICANLTADLLISERKCIRSHMKSSSILVLAGILKDQFGKVQREYERAGLKLVTARTDREWRSAAFQARDNR